MDSYPTFSPRSFQPVSNGPTMMDLSGEGIDQFDMGEGQSLDDIVSHNEKANRRKSMPAYGGAPMLMDSPESRRLSMMAFGDPVNRGLDEFQYNGTAMDDFIRAAPTYPHVSSSIPAERSSAGDLAINTQFSNPNPRFTPLLAAGSAYVSPLHGTVPLEMDMTSPYPTGTSVPLDMNDPTLSMMGADLGMFAGTQFVTPMMDSPITQDFAGPLPPPPPPPPQDSAALGLQTPDQFGTASIGASPPLRSGIPSRTSSQEQGSARSSSRTQSEQPPTTSLALNQAPMGGTAASAPEPTPGPMNIDSFSQIKFPWREPPGGFPSTMNANPHMNTQFKNAYSSTGFDMLAVLMRVATRSKPEIDIGSVDLSCAFVVCDAQIDDHPIVYCSENFERLTGYSKHMILGRNCRFLQSPDGNVEPGYKRKYVDDSSVFYLKRMINEEREAQISLINYRRGGQPFMNLLTMIPIPWEPGGPVKFIVGFQVDLVEQPGSMLHKNPDGSFRVNYQRGLSMPSYTFNEKPHPDNQGQTLSKDEVSSVLSTYGSSTDSDVTRRIWDKVLLENTDDVVHVLSLKGLFLYLSPSSSRMLEYDPSELIGTALSSVCHPSDIVPVTRELKETANSTSVNVVFRIRRKRSGYMWFEGHGSLHTEQGKGRKCIILVGRERPVYTLSKTIVRASGGIGDNELWTKLSTSGMLLFVSSNVRQLLDKQPEELVGTSMQALMRQESKREFGRILELTRTGRKGEVKHEMINKRGQVLQAFTTIYPGDAVEGQKPTFLVGQTRLLKYSRNAHSQRPAMYQTKERVCGESAGSIPSVRSGTSFSGHPGTNTPLSNNTEDQYHTTENSAATYPGQQGLQIGHQDHSLASDENVFDELKTTRSTSWQYELRQMEKRNRYLAEEVQTLLAAKKKRKRRKGAGQSQKDCANCHTKTTPEWRRGPSGNRDLCNSCGLRWAKQNGRVSPRTSSQHSQSDKSVHSVSPRHSQNIMSSSIAETRTHSSIPSTMVNPDRRVRDDSHTAHAVRMEVAASQGLATSIPPKIEEVNEPE